MHVVIHSCAVILVLVHVFGRCTEKSSLPNLATPLLWPKYILFFKKSFEVVKTSSNRVIAVFVKVSF
jgi:hypothetical protein